MLRWLLGLAILFALLALVARVLEFAVSVVLLILAVVAGGIALVLGLAGLARRGG